MKRLFYTIIAGLLLTACEKDYNCTCNIKTTSSSGTTFSTERFRLAAKKQKDAKAACETYKYVPVAPGASATYTCGID